MLSYFVVCSYFVFSSNANFSFNTFLFFSIYDYFQPFRMGFISKKAFKLYVVKPKCTTANVVINIDITNTSKKNESVQKGRGLQRRKFLLYSTKNIIINFKIVIMFFNFLIIIFQAVVIKRKYISKSPKIK